jgi:SAM-dependent methyltransferase
MGSRAKSIELAASRRVQSLRAKTREVVLSIASLHSWVARLRPHEQLFAKAYLTQAWGSAESRSGQGSELGATTSIRPFLPELFERLGIRTFLDAPCGDWNWMRLVDLNGVDYIGVDIVPAVIESNRARFSNHGVRFMLADLTRDDLPRADLVLCRDCWVHLSFQDIAAILDNLRRSGATWLLASNSPHMTRNSNQFTGLRWRHLNLRLAPFRFPPPLQSRADHYPHVPIEIALWRIADLLNVSVGSSKCLPS